MLKKTAMKNKQKELKEKSINKISGEKKQLVLSKVSKNYLRKRRKQRKAG
jgi:hypothetical protein